MLIFYCLLIMLAAFCYVGWPLRMAANGAVDVRGSRAPIDLVAARDELQEELSGLEFDRRMEKLDDSDYQELRAGTARQAGAVLSDIDSGGGDLRNEPAFGEQTANSVILHLDAEAEILVARAKRRLARWQCPKCQRSMAAGDAFCASCATPRPSG